MGVSGQCHAPAALPSRKETQYQLYRRLGGPQDLSGQVWKISPYWGSVLGLSSLWGVCTNYAIPAHFYRVGAEIYQEQRGVGYGDSL